MHGARVLSVLTVGAVLALSACSSDSTGPGDALTDQQMSADVAASSGPEVATGVTLLADAETAGGGLASLVPSSACSSHSATGTLSFAHQDSLQYNVMWEYFALGVCQNTFASASTDSIAFTVLLSEVDNDPRFVVHADRQWFLDVTGTPTLASASTHVWNATGVDADTAVHKTPGLDRTYIGAAYDTATAVTFPNPRNGSLVPTSGTLSRWVVVTVTHTTHGVHKAATIKRHIVVTFNGQTQVPLSMFLDNSGTPLLACTLDLAARRIVTGSCH